MEGFNDRELLLMLNSVHERAMRLLELNIDMCRKGFKGMNGLEPTKEDRDQIYNGHKEHLVLVEKIRTLREN